MCCSLLRHGCGPAALQGEAVAEVASIWNCKNSVAKTLLMSYMWDKDKLMSECLRVVVEPRQQPLAQ